MPIPPNAIQWTQEMDPADLVEYVIELGGGDGLLAFGEEIASYTLTLSAEAVALGLMFSESPGYETLLTSPSSLTIWFEVDPAFRLHSAFEAGGVQLPMELTVVTTSTPARRRQRTLVLKVAQQ